MRAFVIATLVLGIGACTYEWNGDASGLPLVGPVPTLSSFDKLNTTPVGRAAQMIAPDNTPWTIFCEYWSGGSGNNGRNCKQEHLVRLGAAGDAPVDEVFKGDSFGLHGQMLYVIHQDTTMMPPPYVSVTLHRPGDATSDDVSFPIDGTRGQFIVNDSGAADVFVWWNQDPMSPSWVIHRRDQKYERHLPIPSGIDGSGKDTNGIVLALDATGDYFFVRTQDGTLTEYSTLDESQRSLGAMRAPNVYLDDARQALLTVGQDGMRVLPFDGSAERVLYGAAIDVNTLGLTSNAAYFAGPDGVYRARLDMWDQAQLFQPGATRARAVYADSQLVYGTDSPTQYAGGAGDGWLRGSKFMNRGRIVRWSADGGRVYFLENAATIGTYGDLTVADGTSDGPITPQLLSINVHSYDELLDGRIVAVENAVQAGSWNRLVVIDRVAQKRTWLVPEAEEFYLVTGKRDLVVDVASGASGYDVLRVPAPSAN